MELSLGVLRRLRTLKAIREFDLVWIQRNILAGAEWLAGLIKVPTVLDLDDAVWLEGLLAAKRFRVLVKQVDSLIVGNEYLRQYFQGCAPALSRIPTSVDVERYLAVKKSSRPGPRFGWIGTAGNLVYLNEIAEVFRDFVHGHEGASLVVISDRPPEALCQAVGPSKVTFIPWHEAIEFDLCNQFEIGLMPLPDNEWTRGKCSLKLLQYLAAGLPVIASPVGMNADLFQGAQIGFAASTSQEWGKAFRVLFSNPDVRLTYGENGRRLVSGSYSCRAIASQVANHINQHLQYLSA